ncbi:MAG: hypothetical protein ACPG7E_03060 [Marinirhabdus sp.]
MKIATQGTEGPFHDKAVKKLFPHKKAELVKCAPLGAVAQNRKNSPGKPTNAVNHEK